MDRWLRRAIRVMVNFGRRPTMPTDGVAERGARLGRFVAGRTTASLVRRMSRCRLTWDPSQPGPAARDLAARARAYGACESALLGRPAGAWAVRGDQPRGSRACAAAAFMGVGGADSRPGEHAVRREGDAAVASGRSSQRVRDGRQHGWSGDPFTRRAAPKASRRSGVVRRADQYGAALPR